MIQIFVRTITGKSVMIEINQSDTVDTLKFKFQEKEGIPTDL